MEVVITKISEDAEIPAQSNDTDAGYDLYSIEDTYVVNLQEVKASRPKQIRTGITIAIPEWYYGRIAPRSGLAAKNCIGVMAWVIDSWYRWEIVVLLINHWYETLKINKWDRIAQIIIEKCHRVEWVVGNTDDVASERWENWFWSTGS